MRGWSLWIGRRRRRTGGGRELAVLSLIDRPAVVAIEQSELE